AYLGPIEALEGFAGARKEILLIVGSIAQGEEGLPVVRRQDLQMSLFVFGQKARDRQLQGEADHPPYRGTRGCLQPLCLEGLCHAAMDVGLAVDQGAVEVEEDELEAMRCHEGLRRDAQEVERQSS